ncbi:hypothetical protein [Pseudomonas sp. yb_9]|uniref:hypothetical protein n=1 Tax=Pseudomonas sp. yb_9 TaxID=3367222 RepID=UPI00370C49E4
MDKAVAQYLEEKKDRLPFLYDWKFDEALAAEKFAIEFTGANWFEKTLELKNHLRAQASTNTHQHGVIATYFIRDWGGIKRFSRVDETLSLFSQHAGSPVAPVTFTPPFARISSWSKWASVVCPDWACIYDARVAYSLNAINYMNGAEHPIFPMPEGRNTRLRILDINTLLLTKRLESGESSDPKRLKQAHFIPDNQAYLQYLTLVRNVSTLLWDDTEHIHEVEMLLFALADSDIYQDIFTQLARA